MLGLIGFWLVMAPARRFLGRFDGNGMQAWVVAAAGVPFLLLAAALGRHPENERYRPRKTPLVFTLLLLPTIGLLVYSLAGDVEMFESGRLGAWVWRGELTLRLFSAEPITGDVQQADGWGLWGLAMYRQTHITGYSYSVACPLWLMLIAFSLSPAREVVRLSRLRRIDQRRAAGLCTRCGYDLRGSQDRCPECGTQFEAVEPALADRPER